MYNNSIVGICVYVDMLVLKIMICVNKKIELKYWDLLNNIYIYESVINIL